MILCMCFETGRFNCSQPKDYFINACCYGDDVAAWLREKLIEQGVEADEPDQEDWGWYLGASLDDGDSYFLGISAVEEESRQGNEGQWRILVQKHRSLWDKIRKRNVLTPDDRILAVLWHILRQEEDIRNVYVE